MAKRKQSDGHRSAAEGGPDGGLDGAGPETVAPDGPLRYDMPFPATAPRLINPGVGLVTLVGRLGVGSTYPIDVTLLDAPDHRLLRSGVQLAHRVIGERGEWYLAAPDWAPLLPAERTEPMGSGDLPETLAALIRPFRRLAPLSPIAGLTCERREFEFRDEAGLARAVLRDDKVTVRRAGVTTARYREVTLTPTGAGLTAEQREWLADTLSGAGGTWVAEFPPLVSRLGAPATGLTDFPVVEPPSTELPFGAFAARWLAVRLRALIAADLRVSASADDRTTPVLAAELVTEAARLRDEVEALSGVLDTDWIADLDDELDWVIEADPGPSDRTAAAVSRLRTRLRGERYLSILDQLVNAIRAPKVGELSQLPASQVIGIVIDEARADALAVAGELTEDSGPAAWDRAADGLAGYRRALALVEIGPAADPRVRPAERRRVDDALAACRAVVERTRQVAAIRDEAAGAEPTRAFELGRRYERELAELHADRVGFLHRRQKLIKKVGRS